MIVTMAHQKGGVGKSTLATNLAQTLNADILDLDLQHSCVLWNLIRESKGLEPLVCHTAETTDGAEAIMNQYIDSDKFLVVDCGGFDSEINRFALLYSHFIITPVSPAQVELFGLQNFMQILRKADEIAEYPIKTHVAINSADSRSKGSIRDVQNYVEDNQKELTLMKTVVHCLSDFNKAYSKGVSVVELNPNGKAAAEIKNLTKEIQSGIKDMAKGLRESSTKAV